MSLRRTVLVCVLIYTFSSTGLLRGLDAQPSPIIESIYASTELGEGPHWDHVEQQLYFVDIVAKSIKRYDPRTSRTKSVSVDDTPSLIIPIHGENDKFLITLGTKVAVMTWDGNSAKPSHIEILASVGNPHDGSRINDGKADPLGRLWAGTMGRRIGEGLDFEPGVGVLFSLEKHRNVRIHEVGITVSNGIAWSLNHKKMYYIDTIPRVIYVYDYDLHKGNISNRRILFDFEANGVSGLPDGMTIDTEGKLWVACFGGGQVIRVDPLTGQLLRTVPIPSSQTTSVAFGGPNFDVLYVTSANVTVRNETLGEFAGHTFLVTGLGVQGLPAQRVLLKI